MTSNFGALSAHQQVNMWVLATHAYFYTNTLTCPLGDTHTHTPAHTQVAILWRQSYPWRLMFNDSQLTIFLVLSVNCHLSDF